MAKETISKRGGAFLIEESSPEDIFTPEDFSEEQTMIRDMTAQFVEDEVLPQVEKIEHKDYPINGNIAQAVSYGPWKNLFFASYFAATGVHGLHIIGGMIPLSMLAIQAMRGRLFPAGTEYIGLYWHFVDLVWIFLFPLMYLI